MKTYSGDELVNIGTGEDITIAEFARVVAATVGYTRRDQLRHLAPGRHPAKTARRQPAGRSSAGAPRTSLEEGIRLAYQAYLDETK